MSILALIGSGEFTDAMIETDRFLLAQIKDPVVVIIPTAAGQEDDYEKWITDGIKHFEKLGAKAFGTHILNTNDANDPEILAQLNRANFFYFSGGDPGYLLDVMKGSEAWNLILEKYNNGSVLAGSSAGAMVMGKKVMARIYNYFKSGNMSEWEEGLNLVDFGIIPHFDKFFEDLNENQVVDLKMKLPTNIEIVGIDEDTSYIRLGNKWQDMGRGNIHRPAFK